MLLIHPTLEGVTLDVSGSGPVAQAVKAGWVKPGQDADAPEAVPESTPEAVPEAARD